MKILQIVASCSRSSGVAQVIMNYYRQIHNRVTFDFLLFWDVEKSFKEEILSLNGQVFVTGKPGLVDLPQYLQKLDSFFAEHAGEYDAIHLNEVYLNALVFPIARRHGVPVLIAHSHATKLSESKLGAVRNRVLFYSARFLATDFLGCSRDAGIAAFGKRICQKEKFHVLRNAVHTETFLFSDENRERIRREFSLNEKNLLIGHVGRFTPPKNHFFLLEVFCEVQKQYSDARLILVGEGKLFEDVQSRAQMLGIGEKVIQTGPRKDVGELLSAMDVFVLPSVFEGLGIVLVEAQCNGLACIASDVVPKEASILPTYCALALKKGPEVWAEEILNCKKDRVHNAQKLVEKAGYEIEIEARLLYELYHEMCEGSTG